MILKTFLRQPREDKDYDVDFSPWLIPIGDTLDNVDFYITNLDDPDIADLEVYKHVITEHKLKLWVRGGTDGCAYKVEIVANTVGGRVDESELIFATGEI